MEAWNSAAIGCGEAIRGFSAGGAVILDFQTAVFLFTRMTGMYTILYLFTDANDHPTDRPYLPNDQGAPF